MKHIHCPFYGMAKGEDYLIHQGNSQCGVPINEGFKNVSCQMEDEGKPIEWGLCPLKKNHSEESLYKLRVFPPNSTDSISFVEWIARVENR